MVKLNILEINKAELDFSTQYILNDMVLNCKNGCTLFIKNKKTSKELAYSISENAVFEVDGKILKIYDGVDLSNEDGIGCWKFDLNQVILKDVE